MSSYEDAKLRAEAPVFVPSFTGRPDSSVKKNTQQHRGRRLPKNPTSGPADASADNAGRKSRQKCRRKKTHSNDTLSAKRESENTQKGDGKLRGAGRGGRNSDLKGSAPKQGRLRNNRRRGKDAGRGRDSRNRYGCHHQATVEDGDGQGNDIDDNPVALPLHEESAFPSLGGSALPPTFSSNSSAKNAANTWQNSEKKRNLLHAPPAIAQKMSADEARDDEFAAMGLEKLSTKALRGPKSTFLPEYSSWDVDEVNHSTKAIDEISEEELSKNDDQVQIDDNFAVRIRRPHWNMGKLRDKWWDALEQRRIRKTVILELQDLIKGRFVEPTEFEDLPAALQWKEGPDSVEAIDDDVAVPSPLQSLLDDHVSDSSNSDQGIFERVLCENDPSALDELLDAWDESSVDLPRGNYTESVSFILERIVQLELPQLLNVALRRLNESQALFSGKGGKDDGSIEVAKTLMLAANLGYDDCISVFLTRWDNVTSLFTVRDENGNGVMHHSCQGQGNAQVLQMLIRHISGGTKSKQQQLSKVLLLKNKSTQTALHVACENGRVDLVEVFLAECSTALLAKNLALEDDRSQTPLLAAVEANASDVVMCLIMWRGNRNLILRKTPQTAGKLMGNGFTGKGGRFTGVEGELPSCPMVWAAKSGNLDMIQLLLQFSDPSGKDYQITEAISALLLSDAGPDIKAEGSQLLVHDGGNPFAEIASGNTERSASTAVNIAARLWDNEVLHSLVSSGLYVLCERQQGRRRDPKLQQQPETFFKAMECKEDFEKERAIADALVESLFRGWEAGETGGEQPWQPFAAAVALFMLGASLREKDKARLHTSIRIHYLKSAALFLEEPSPHSYVTSYLKHVHSTAKISKVSEIDRSMLSVPSQLLLQMTWFQEQIYRRECSCGWINDSCGDRSIPDRQNWEDDHVVLISDDGTRFLVHDSIVSAKSAKLASALRFSTMKGNSDGDANNDMRVLHLDVPTRHCGWMLQHIYHGSICCGWSHDRRQQCHDILELMLVAEEFLCYSLLQECEMRLLHTNPSECFCWSCARAVRCYSVEDRTAECLYIAHGASQLVNGNTVLDVLAVLQDLEGMDIPYVIHQVARPPSLLKCVAPGKLWEYTTPNAADDSPSSNHQAVSSLKHVSMGNILDCFPEVVSSSSFQENAEWNESSKDVKANDDENDILVPNEVMTQRILLLQMCMEVLATVKLPKTYGRYTSALMKPSGVSYFKVQPGNG